MSVALHIEFERMYDDRDEWITYVVDGARRGIGDAIIQGDPRNLSDDDVVSFRSLSGRRTMRLGDLKEGLLRPEARLTPASVEEIIALLGLGDGE